LKIICGTFNTEAKPSFALDVSGSVSHCCVYVSAAEIVSINGESKKTEIAVNPGDVITAIGDFQAGDGLCWAPGPVKTRSDCVGGVVTVNGVCNK
jgi:hypothetical protein